MIAAIVQARMGSTRLPGKSMADICGKPLIFYAIHRIKKSCLIDNIILATTDKEEDKVLLEKAQEYDILSFAGSSEDVLDRFYTAAKKFGADIVVRITADCPLIDPEITDKIIQTYLDNKDKVDYVSNIHPPSYPEGLSVEVFSFSALFEAWKGAKLPYQREHVTYYISENPDKFKMKNVNFEKDLSYIHLSVDTQEELKFIREIYGKLKTIDFNLNDLLNVINGVLKES